LIVMAGSPSGRLRTSRNALSGSTMPIATRNMSALISPMTLSST
jgi:hypothetical protein